MTPTVQPALAPALTDARIENGRLEARIGADQQNDVRLIDALDGGIEHVARAPELRVQLAAVLTAIEVLRAQPLEQVLEREHLLGAREVASDGADARRIDRLELGRRRRASASSQLGGLEPPVLADVGLVETLRAQAVGHVARLVGDPLLVHGVVVARQDAHHLAPARIDPDRRAERIHDVDDFGLAQLPGPRVVRPGPMR